MIKKRSEIWEKNPWLLGLALMALFVASSGLPSQAQDALGSDAKLLALDPAGPGETPRLFALGTVTSPFSEYNLTISPAGDEIFYSIEIQEVTGQYKTFLVALKWDKGLWSRPEILPFSAGGLDSQPVISPDGRTLIFLSRRPLVAGTPARGSNFWAVDRKDGSWGTPYPLEAVNSDVTKMMPFVHRNGDLYFCAAPPGGQSPQHIFVSKYSEGRYQKPEQLKGGVNTPKGEYNPALSPDGNLLFLELVDGPGESGQGDIYICRKTGDGSWGEPKNLGNLFNTPVSECRLMYSPGGNYVFFQSPRRPRLNDRNNPVTYNLLMWNSHRLGEEAFDFYWIKASVLEKALSLL
jgi:hypothetical protein